MVTTVDRDAKAQGSDLRTHLSPDVDCTAYPLPVAGFLSTDPALLNEAVPAPSRRQPSNESGSSKGISSVSHGVNFVLHDAANRLSVSPEGLAE